MRVRHRNALTEIAWEVASEKNREMLFIGEVFYKQWNLCELFH